MLLAKFTKIRYTLKISVLRLQYLHRRAPKNSVFSHGTWRCHHRTWQAAMRLPSHQGSLYSASQESWRCVVLADQTDKQPSTPGLNVMSASRREQEDLIRYDGLERSSLTMPEDVTCAQSLKPQPQTHLTHSVHSTMTHFSRYHAPPGTELTTISDIFY